MSAVPELLARAEAGDLQADDELLRLAASGSLEAQRAMLDAAMRCPDAPARSELIARMVAARGDIEDHRKLAAVLWASGEERRNARDHETALEYEVEALSLARSMADAGDGRALAGLGILAPRAPEAWAMVEAHAGPSGLAVPADDVANAKAVAEPEPVEDWLASLPPLTRRERVKIYFSDIGWAVRAIGWDICSVGRSLADLAKTIIGRG
jgi:hypothetical protein